MCLFSALSHLVVLDGLNVVLKFAAGGPPVVDHVRVRKQVGVGGPAVVAHHRSVPEQEKKKHVAPQKYREKEQRKEAVFRTTLLLSQNAI